MFQLLYSWGKSPWYPLDRRLGGPISLNCSMPALFMEAEFDVYIHFKVY